MDRGYKLCFRYHQETYLLTIATLDCHPNHHSQIRVSCILEDQSIGDERCLGRDIRRRASGRDGEHSLPGFHEHGGEMFRGQSGGGTHEHLSRRTELVGVPLASSTT